MNRVKRMLLTVQKLPKSFTNETIEDIRAQLNSVTELNFIRIMEELYLSRYADGLLQHSKAACVDLEGGNITYVRGGDILMVEVIGYGSVFSVKIIDLNNVMIPKTYNYGQTICR